MDTHIWQIIATTSIGIIITLIGFWAGIIKNVVTKNEIAQIIEAHSPYLKDKQYHPS